MSLESVPSIPKGHTAGKGEGLHFRARAPLGHTLEPPSSSKTERRRRRHPTYFHIMYLNESHLGGVGGAPAQSKSFV